MAIKMSTSNKSLTSKRSTMVRTTFPRQLVIFQLAKQFSISRVVKSADSSKVVIFIPKQNHQEHITVV
jgi:uncharacterized protein YccT (UPF0319 family)